MASVSNWISLAISLALAQSAGSGPSVPLLVGSSAKLPVSQPIRSYSQINDVANDFATTDPEYIAAAVFFQQSPHGKQLWIGRRFTANVAAQLSCGALNTTQQAIANFTAVTTGGFTCTIDGTLRTITAIDLHLQTTLTGVASVIQTALRVSVANATCVWYAATGQFLIGSPTTGASSTITVLGAPGSGTDISALLGGTSATGAQIFNGVVADTDATASLTRLAAFRRGWTGVALTSEATTTDLTNAAVYCEANNILHFYTLQNANALLTGDTSTLFYTFKAASYTMSHGVYSGQNANAAVAVMSRAFSVDFSGSNTTITMWGKALVGIAADNLNDTQLAALRALNANFYTSVTSSDGSALSMYAEATQADGSYLDQRHGLIWLAQTLSSKLFNAIQPQPTKVPQTDKGVDTLVAALESGLTGAVVNGLGAPGVYTGQPFGNLATGQTLPTGFYVYAASIASQDSVSRAARRSPALQWVLIGAGALQGVSVSGIFQP
jgi:Protein of unknown function (DUF3383)